MGRNKFIILIVVLYVLLIVIHFCTLLKFTVNFSRHRIEFIEAVKWVYNNPIKLFFGGGFKESVLWIGLIPISIANYMVRDKNNLYKLMFISGIFYVLNLIRVYELLVMDVKSWIGAYIWYLDNLMCILGLLLIFVLLTRAAKKCAGLKSSE